MYDIVILDSGVNICNNEQINGFSIKREYGEPFVVHGDVIDHIGHGTIIYQIIRKCSPLSKILVIKIFDAQNEIDENDLMFVLRYIKENIQCRIINMSLGLKICQNINSFRRLCAEIVAAGIIIVAAFDNDNCYSYPACFDEVIGVDNNERINNLVDYEYVESSPINIRAKGGVQRIRLEDGKIVIASGSSIACAYITAYIANSCKDSVLKHDSVLAYLKEHAIHVYKSETFNKCDNDKNIVSHMKKVAVFPISKEMHAFIRFNDMLLFKIQHYYDVRYSGRVGMRINRFYTSADAEVCIEDIEKAEFEDIDTIIIGHLDELNELCSRDFRKELLQDAVRKGINVYSFDPLDKYQSMLSNSSIKFFYPKVCESDVPQNTFGKLYKISKPVVGIYGTSSRQGKFSLQLTLKRIFEANEYQVASIGTEPHSLLFNMDKVYPMGYNSTICINPWQSITYLNDQIHKLCESDAELIIVASQAGSTSQNFNNLMDYPIKQSIFLMGTHPDAIILCINIYDEISYIRNTIHVLQGLSDAKVVALVMYPLSFPQDLKNRYHSRTPMSKDEFEKAAQLLYTAFNIPVYLLGDEEHMLRLYQDIVDFF